MLWEPPASITQEGARRRARVAMALLLAMAALGLVNVLMTFSGVYGQPSRDSLLELGIILGLVAAYLLARSGRVALGVLLAVVSIEFALLYYRSQAPEGPGELAMLYFLSIPILLAGLLMRARDASLVAALTIGLAFLSELYIHGLADFVFDVDEIGLILMLVAVAVLSVTAAALNERDAQLLQETTALLKQITDNIPEVMFIVEGDGSRMLYTSPAYETVTGRPVAQAMADPQDWVKAVHPDDLAGVQAALAGNKPELEYRIVHPTRGVRHLRARTFPVLGPDGRLARIVGIAEDVTVTVQAGEKVREAQRQRIHLLQQLAHDLASPLSPVKIQLRILKDRVGPDGQKALAIVQRNVDHVQRLVEDVKDVARLESSGLKLDRKSTDLAALARSAIETLAPAAAERQVKLGLDAPASLPASADAGRVTQVMYNLVGNALKFTPTNGRIDVELRVMEQWAEVSVRDSGAGMRPDQLEKLFQPFVQVHDAAVIQKAEDKGTGLGLYISKGIVEAHGGTIAAASAGPGQGSTFTFRLPLA